MLRENYADLFATSTDVSDWNFEQLCSESTLEIYYQIDSDQKKFEFSEKLIARAIALKRKTDFSSWWKPRTKVKKRTSTISNMEDLPLKNLDFGQYGITNKGLYVFDEKQGEVFFADSTPLVVTKILHNIDNEPNKVELSYKLRNIWKSVVVRRRDVIDNRAILNLSDYEINVNSANAGHLVQYITKLIAQNTDKIPIERSVGRLGWYNGEFIPYDCKYTYDGALTNQGVFNALHTQGEFAKWFEQFNKVRRENDIVRFYTAASFASPLLELLDAQNFIVHLWGNTEFGKTVSHMLAMSIWGNPEKLMFTFNATAVFLERQAAFLRNIPFAINELETVKDRFTDTDRIIYQLCEGQSKGRGAKTGGTEDVKFWHLIMLTNGERALTDEKSGAGAINRSIELNSKAPLYSCPAELCDCIRENYGHAGKQFIDFVKTLDNQMLKTMFKKIHKDIQGFDFMEKQTNGIATVCLADYIVNRLFYELDEADAYKDTLRFITLLKGLFISKSEVNTTGRAFDNFVSWCEQNAHKFIEGSDKERYGAFTAIKNVDYICILPTAFDEWCEVSGFQRKMIIAGFVQDKLLIGSEVDRYRTKFLLNGRYVRGYKIKRYADAIEKLEELDDFNADEMPF